MAKMSRRDFVKGIATLAAFSVAGLAVSPTIDYILRPRHKRVSSDPQFGSNVRYVYSTCLGCNVRCGIRVRVVNYDGVEVVERIEGNPYHPYNRAVSMDSQTEAYDQLPYDTPVSEATQKWFGKLCPKGQDGIHYLYDPYRVIKPLKRAGPRGSGKWEVISWEQLLDEIINGATFKDGTSHPGIKSLVAYLKLKEAGVTDPNTILGGIKNDVDAILNDLEAGNINSIDELNNRIEAFKNKWNSQLQNYGLTLEDILIDPDNPDLGPKANQIVFIRGRGQGHADYIQERFMHALGSVNWLRHTSACQLGYYAGNKMIFGYSDINPDFRGAKVLIMAGVQWGRLHPGATGQGAIIERAVEGKLKIYYVNPIAPRTTARGNIIWVPIKPGTDAALAMALIRWMFEHNAYNAEFLSIPNETAADNKGEPVYTNATWLVIADENHPRFGEFVKERDLGGTEDVPVVYTGSNYVKHTDVDTAELFHTATLNIDGQPTTVKTVLQMIKDEAFSNEISKWAQICGVDVAMIEQMARDFSSAGRQAATYVHRGVGMHTNGEYNVMAYRTLDVLVGNYHRKGGLMGRADHLAYNNYIYNLDKKGFGEPVSWGPHIDRTKSAYERTLEYWRKKLSGEKLYPAKRPWYPLTPEESYTEFFAGVEEEYPYKIFALFLYFANPVLSANRGTRFINVLKDPQKLPLFVGITTTINETFLYADYIVPDTTYLETGTLGVQYLYASSWGVEVAAAFRSPAIWPLTEKISENPPRWSSMFEFLIDLAKNLGLPGFGAKGIQGTPGRDHDGEEFDLNHLWDYILRIYANAARDAQDRGLIPSNIPDDHPDVKFVEDNYPIAQIQKQLNILPDSEWKAVAYALARGGVFKRYEDSFDSKGVSLRKVPRKVLYLWNEDLAKARNSITGEKFWGGPKYFPPAFYAPVQGASSSTRITGLHGTPIRDVYSEEEYPFIIIIPGSPLYTKHRSQFYYFVKQIMPENFVVMNPEDAASYGIETGDVIRITTPYGKMKAKVVVEPSVTKGVLAVPVGMGRWADTVVVKPDYIEEIKDVNLELPDSVEIPEEAVNPVKQLDETHKELLFTKRPKEFYETGLKPDKWRFNGYTANPIMLGDDSLKGWPLLSWVGASQVFYYHVGKVEKTGEKAEIETLYHTY